MPIRPEHVSLYPVDWQHISRLIRFKRAGGVCERCWRPYGTHVFHLGDGRWWDADRVYWRRAWGRRARRPTEDILVKGKWTKTVPVCAHLHHNPGDSAFDKLAALCQRCPMIHDAAEHRRRRWLNAPRRQAPGELFYGPYPHHGADWSTPMPISMLEDGRAIPARVWHTRKVAIDAA